MLRKKSVDYRELFPENQMDEEKFTKKLADMFPQGKDILVGPGDDCAVIDNGSDPLMLAAADQLISSVHYLGGVPPCLRSAETASQEHQRYCCDGRSSDSCAGYAGGQSSG